MYFQSIVRSYATSLKYENKLILCVNYATFSSVYIFANILPLLRFVSPQVIAASWLKADGTCGFAQGSSTKCKHFSTEFTQADQN